MAIKDIKTALENFEKGMMKNKGSAKIGLYEDMEKLTLEELKGATIIPFGIPEVDEITGVGGIPLGRIIEIYGPESGGKSYLTLKLIASAQRMGKRAALIDAEYSFHPGWATSHGVNIKELILGKNFDYGEEALQYVLEMTKKKLADLIVVDSITALVPKAEAEANFEDQQMGVQARMLSRALRAINDECGKNNVTVVFINQLREKIGVMFGNPETTPGGRALKFYAAMRIRVNRIKMEYEDLPGSTPDKPKRQPLYAQSKVKFEKNKVAVPFRESEFLLYFIPSRNSPELQLVDKAYELRVLNRKTNDEGKMEFVWGKGKEAAFTGSEDNQSMAEWLEMNEKWGEVIKAVTDKAKEKGLLDKTLTELISSVQSKVVVEAVEPAETKIE